MTRWGALLLLLYITLGLSGLESRTVARLAVGATAVVMAGVALKIGVL